MADKPPKEPNTWDYVLGQVMAKIDGLTESIKENTKTINNRMDEMHDRTKEDVAEIKAKADKLEERLNATNAKVNKNTVISGIVISLIIAALVTALKAEIL